MRRADILAEARRWIGTPYRHQASVCGAGCDCLGLVRGIWRNLIGPEPMLVPAYTPDWFDRQGEETLLNAAGQFLIERDHASARTGDVLLFRPHSSGPAKHCGVLSDHGRLLHAYWGRAVCETSLGPWWQRRLAGVFSFPGCED